MDLAASASVIDATVLAVDPSKVKPGWTAFIVFVVLVVAVAVLLRSFTKQLKKVTFDEDATDQRPRRTEHAQQTEHTDQTEHTERTEHPEHPGRTGHTGDDATG